MTLSSQAAVVLRTLAEAPEGQCSVADLVGVVRRPGASVNVTRASLSRTLRRMWRAGLVELTSGWWRTMTDAHQSVLATIAQHEADPEAAYEGYQQFVQSIGFPDRHGSVEAFMAAQRARAAKPDLRITKAEITEAGRERLTAARTTELTESAPGRLTRRVRAKLTESTSRLTVATSGELTGVQS